MYTESDLNAFEDRMQRVCRVQARYPVLWLVGPPQSGKTALCKAASERKGWRYVNYTLDSGFLDQLVGIEENYRPEDLLSMVHSLCKTNTTQPIIIDEIEPLVGLWPRETQDYFFRLLAHTENLKCGVVLVTRIRTYTEMLRHAPNADHVFKLNTGASS